MTAITLNLAIHASPEEVWAHLSDLSSHSNWMSDAGEIDFLSDERRGVGTIMRVPTRVGPLHTNDVMTVVEWEECHRITVEHEGAVAGRGSFEILPIAEGTSLTWTESLSFPWWFGGSIGSRLAAPILRRIWHKNLGRLKETVERETAR